jgi:hypothetical protein
MADLEVEPGWFTGQMQPAAELVQKVDFFALPIVWRRALNLPPNAASRVPAAVGWQSGAIKPR